MKLSQIKAKLTQLDKIAFQLPNGELVPSHFHVTEVGKVTKHFIDCGGTERKETVVNFQLWEENDYNHRLHPEKLVHIMRDLKIKKETDPEAEYNKDLTNLRAQIDVIDSQLIDMMGKRMKISDGIGELKKQKNVAVLQSVRWNQILGAMILDGESKGLSEEFVLKMFKAIHQESINHQEKIING